MNTRKVFRSLTLTLLLTLNTLLPALSYAQITPIPNSPDQLSKSSQSSRQVSQLAQTEVDNTTSSSPLNQAGQVASNLASQVIDDLSQVASEVSDSAEAAYLQNDSDGFYYVDFIGNDAGVVPNGGFGGISNNYLSNNIAGTVSIDPAGGNTATVSTVEIRPNSFDGWNQVELEATYSSTNAIKINLLTCDDNLVPNTPIPGFQNLTLSGGVVDISSLNHIPPTGYDCIRVQVVMDNLAGSIPAPVVSKIKASWIPLPVLLIDHLTPDQVEVGQVIVNTLRLSVSYAEACEVVAYAPLPETGATDPDNYVDNYTPSYGQNPNPSLIEASDNGAYTASQITIGDTTIPANSVYWDLGCLKAGYTGKLTYKLKTLNGWENGILYHTQAYAGAESPVAPVTSDSDKTTSGAQKNLTELISTPKPVIDKTVSGTFYYNYIHYVYDNATAGYTPQVTYYIKISNAINQFTGVETIFNASISDDLSDIYDKLANQCGVATPGTRISNISTGGVLDDTTLGSEVIDWTGLGNMLPNQSKYVSFSVNYAGCPDDQVINNTATFSADNISDISDAIDVVINLPADIEQVGIYPRKYFGDTTYNNLSTISLPMINSGTTTLGDLVTIDKIPKSLADGDTVNNQPHSTDFVNASLPNGVNGSIWYRTDEVDRSMTDPPGYDPLTGVMTGWIDYLLNPPADPSDVTWVAFRVDCLNSNLFDAPTSGRCANQPTSTTAKITVKAMQDTTCSIRTLSNQALFYAYEGGSELPFSDPLTAPQLPSDLATPLQNIQSDPALISPVTPRVITDISGPVGVTPPGEIEYTIKLSTLFETALNTVVTIPTPVINVGGANTYLKLVNVDTTTGSVDLSKIYSSPYQMTINLGNLPAGSSETITIKYLVSAGTLPYKNIDITPTTTYQDNANCPVVGSTDTIRTQIYPGVASLITYKEVTESLIPTGDNIHYALHFQNIGINPTTQTWVVDKVPDKTVLDYLYLNGTDPVGNSYSCTNCKAYFSKSIPPLPSDLSPSDPLDPTIINNNFTLGTQEANPSGGTRWVSPFGIETSYFAVLVDNSALTPSMFPVGAIGSVGVEVTNDSNNTTPTVEGSPAGSIISNSNAILSSELLQAIAPPVFTTILPSPGLAINKYEVTSSGSEVLKAGEAFQWKIDYLNDSGTTNSVTRIIDHLPAGVSLSSIKNSFNSHAISQGASSGEVDITTNPVVSIVSNLDGTATITIEIANDDGTSPSLRGSGLGLADREGGVITLNLVADTDLVTGSIITNKADGYYEDSSGKPGQVTDTDTLVVRNPDLAISKQVSRTDPIPSSAPNQDFFNYTLLVSNEGLASANNVVITDTLDPGICYNSATPTVISVSGGWSLPAPTVSGTCASGQTLTWNGTIDHTSYPTGTIPALSEQILITYKVYIDQSIANNTTLSNNVSVSSTDIESPDNYPNTATSSVTTPEADPYAIKVGERTVIPGETWE